MMRRRGLRITVATITFLLVLIGGYALYAVATGNFHAITPGEAYRSAQLDKEHLEYYTSKFGIRSILNLRGENPDKQWYVDELNFSTEHKLANYDIALSSSDEPSKAQSARIMGIIRTAPRPILIHCRAGADRSGLVAAMWKVAVDNEPKSEAKKQLTLLCGHIPLFGRVAMDSFFEKWDPAIQYSY